MLLFLPDCVLSIVITSLEFYFNNIFTKLLFYSRDLRIFYNYLTLLRFLIQHPNTIDKITITPIEIPTIIPMLLLFYKHREFFTSNPSSHSAHPTDVEFSCYISYPTMITHLLQCSQITWHCKHYLSVTKKFDIHLHEPFSGVDSKLAVALHVLQVLLLSHA